jgi:hypothetical protein
MRPVLTLLQQAPAATETGSKVTPDALRTYLVTWAGYSILILLVAVLAWWFFSFWARRRITAAPRPRRRRAIKDAWTEAGKRVEAPPPEDFGDSPDDDDDADDDADRREPAP